MYELHTEHWSGGSLTIHTDDRLRIRDELNKALDEMFDGEINEITVKLEK